MTRTKLRIFFIALTLVLGVYLLPQLPWVHHWLMNRVQGALQTAGYRLDYRASGGNIWSQLRLAGVNLEGPGIDVDLDQLSLEYNLLPLLIGRLPLSLTVSEAHGELSLAELSLPDPDAAGPGIEVVLEQLAVAHATLNIREIPYTLPDMTIAALQISNSPTGFRLDTTLHTSEGEAELSALVRQDPFVLEADIIRADARLGRHWWEGVEAGTVHGAASIREGEILAELELEGGIASLLELTIHDVHGPVRYQQGTVHGELQGQALGGALRASARVDPSDSEWSAEVSGDAALAPALAWLFDDLLEAPIRADALDPSGDMQLDLTLSGWQDIHLRGQAVGEGTLRDEPLEALVVDFGFESGTGVQVATTATWANGPLALNLNPIEDGFKLDFQASDLTLMETLEGRLEGSVESRAGTLEGTVRLDTAGTLAGRELSTTFSARTTLGVWAFHVSGQDTLGAQLSGSAALDNGQLSGAISLSGMTLPGLATPLNARLTTAGPLDALPLRLTLHHERGLTPALANLTSDLDLNGELSATLRQGRLEDLRGALGSLSLAGTLALAPLRGNLDLTLAETELRGPVQTTVQLAGGHVTFDEEGVRSRARLETSTLRGFEVSLPGLSAELQLAYEDTLSLTLNDETRGVSVELGDERLRVGLQDTPLDLFAERFTLSGTLQTTLAALRDDLQLELSVASSQAQVRAQGDLEVLELALSSAPGARFGPVMLAEAVNVSGELRSDSWGLTLSGNAGALQIALDADLAGLLADEASLHLDADVTHAGERLALLVSGALPTPRLQANGTLSLEPIGRLLDLPLSGRAQANLSTSQGRYQGQAQIEGSASGQPFHARFEGVDGTLHTALQAPIAGMSLELTGRLLPTLDARLVLDERYAATLEGDYPNVRIGGSGTLEPTDIEALRTRGLELDPLPWTLTGRWSENRVRLDLGDSRLAVSRTETGWRLDSNVRQQVRWNGLALELSGLAAVSSSNPAGWVEGALRVRGETQGETREYVLELGGNVEALSLSGSVPAALMNDALGGADLLGTLELDARVNLYQGPQYQVTARWITNDTLTVNLEGEGARAQLSAAAPGLEASLSYQPGTPTSASLTADDFQLDRFLPLGALATMTLNGTLEHRAGRYQGALSAQTAAPVATLVRLSGEDERLMLEATSEAAEQAFQASAVGELLPRTELSLSASLAELVSFSGTVAQREQQLQLSGELRSEAFVTPPAVGLALPATTTMITGHLAEGIQLSFTGNVISASLADGVWSGELELPLDLHAQPHTLIASLTGELTHPQLHGALTGPYLQGPLRVSPDGGAFTAELMLAPWLPDTLPLASAEARLEGTASPELGWSLNVRGQTDYQATPLELTGELSGSGASYRGAGQLEVASYPLDWHLSGEAARGEAHIGVEAYPLDALTLSAQLQGTLNGGATLRYDDDGLDYSLDIRAEGEVQAQPFALRLSADEARGFELSGNVAEATLEAHGALTTAGELTLAVAHTASDSQLELRGNLEDASNTLTLSAQGRYGGEALELSGRYDWAARSGGWQGELAGLSWQGELSPHEEGGVRLGSTLRAPGGLPGLGETPFSAQLDALIQAGGVQLEQLRADSELGGAPASLYLSGRAWPQDALALQGTLEQDLLPEPVQLQVQSLGAGYHLSLTQQALELRAALSPSLDIEHLYAGGSLALEQPFPARAAANLRWSAEAGFSGHAELQATPTTDSAIRIEARGQDELLLTSHLDVQGNALATATLRTSRTPWRDARLNGRVRLEADSRQFTSALASSLQLSGELELNGSLRDPQLSGPLQLDGALAASGSLRATLAGASLELLASGLSLQADANAQGWQLTGGADGLALDALLPQLTQPRLEAEVRAEQNWGEALEISAEPLRLRAPHSTVSGRVHYQGSVQATFEAELDARDVTAAGMALEGQLRGPLTLTRSDSEGALALSGALELAQLRPAGASAWLSGHAGLEGTLQDPDISVFVTGEGEANGHLAARAQPAHERLELESTLRVGALSSDITLHWAEQRLNAQGELAFADYALSLEAGEPNIVDLLGSGRLQDWRGRLDLGAAELTFAGPLTRLADALQGNAELSLDWAELARPQLSGQLRHLQLADIPLGNLTLSSNADPSATLPSLELSGEALRLRAYFDASELHWQLERSQVPVTADLYLDAHGRGTLEQAQLEATLRGTFASESLELPLFAHYRHEQLQIVTDTPLLGGRVAGQLDYHPEVGWRGNLEAEALNAHGATLTLSSQLSGAVDRPQLAGQLELGWGDTTLAGNFSLSPEAVQLEQQLHSPMLASPLQVRGTLWPEPALVLATSEQNRLELSTQEGHLQAQGTLELALGPLNLRAKAETAPGDWFTLALRAPTAPGLALAGTLPRTAPSALWSTLERDGLRLEGRDSSEGGLVLQLADGPSLDVDAFAWHAPAGTLSLEGQLRSVASGLTGTVHGRWQGERRAERLFFPWLAELDEALAFTIEASAQTLTLSTQNGLGSAQVRLDTSDLSASLRADLSLAAGRAQANLDYTRARGPSGQLNLTRVPLLEGRGEEDLELFVDSSITLSPEGLMGTGGLEVSGRRVNLFGELGWARLVGEITASTFFPQGTLQSELQIRASNFELAELPGIERRLPQLSAPLSGVVQLQGERLIGQFNLPELAVAGTGLPARLELSGSLTDWELRGTLGRSRVKVGLTQGVLAGLVNFELFPLHLLVEAALGRSDVSSSLTAPLRFEIPLDAPQESVLRLATERFWLERGGVMTEGDVALIYEAGRLRIEQAEFRGRGAWQASGQVAPDALDLRVEAEASDFTPLLGLIPALATFNVGAQGSFTLTTDGSLEAPQATFESSELDLQVAGSSYRLSDTRFTLGGGRLRGQSRVNGLEPVTGELTLNADGPLSLLPFDSSELTIDLRGSAERPLNVPLFGIITDIEGRISGDLEAGLPLELRGQLGNPFTLSGTLAPLDIGLQGKDLIISAPQLFVASSRADAELRVHQQDDTFRISGGLLASEARVSFAEREVNTLEVEEDDVPEFYERFIYDDIRIRAPQQVSLRENFGSLDASLDLLLAGNLAQPTLSGEARTLRGTIRFSGRDFTLRQAVASFDPTRGVFPSVNLVAETSFDKARALPSGAAQRVDFVEPRGSSFQVVLTIDGGFEETVPGVYQLQLTTGLSSDARVDEAGVGTRPLSEDELLTLIALGRLELSPALAGRGGFAGSVAETALSTTVDLFVLSELQSALGDALGLQLFEIRTTPIGSLLAGNGDPFGVSFRLGGYVSDDLFATYQIGSTTEVDEPFSIRNELSLRYDLAPLELILTGSLGIADGVTNPALSASLGYALSTSTGLEMGFDLSNLEQRARFGIFYRW